MACHDEVDDGSWCVCQDCMLAQIAINGNEDVDEEGIAVLPIFQCKNCNSFELKAIKDMQ